MKKKRYIWCRYYEDIAEQVQVDSTREQSRTYKSGFCSVFYDEFRKVFPAAPKHKHGLRFRIDITNAKVIEGR